MTAAAVPVVYWSREHQYILDCYGPAYRAGHGIPWRAGHDEGIMGQHMQPCLR